jgi:hypothetical protein
MSDFAGLFVFKDLTPFLFRAPRFVRSPARKAQVQRIAEKAVLGGAVWTSDLGFRDHTRIVDHISENVNISPYFSIL